MTDFLWFGVQYFVWTGLYVAAIYGVGAYLKRRKK